MLSPAVQPSRVLATLAAALRPGGWLGVEDFDSGFADAAQPATAAEALVRFVDNAFNQMLVRRGGDPAYARTLPHRLERAGLSRVGAEGRLIFARGGSAAAGIQVANLKQVGSQLVAAKLATGDDVSRAISLLEDPTLIWVMPMMISAWGQRG